MSKHAIADERPFIIAHVSDLHFVKDRVPDRAGPIGHHSVELLKAAESEIRRCAADCLVVSGDLSEQGDTTSLLNARDWLFGTLGIVARDDGTQVTGLQFPACRTVVVPGNHDATNPPRSGRFERRRSVSLLNYNEVFTDHQVMLDESHKGCDYRYFENGASCVYIAAVDSSYLGPHNGEDVFDERTRGKIAVEQSEQLLRWHSDGMRGRLSDGTENNIAAEKFAASIKVAVMHHHLYAPQGSSAPLGEPYRQAVVCNLILAEFNLLLCGHTHAPFTYKQPYAELLTPRARYRCLLNCFRRHIGLDVLPLQLPDNRGRKHPRSLSTLLRLFTLFVHAEKPHFSEQQIGEQIERMLIDSIHDQRSFEESVCLALARANSIPADERQRLGRELDQISRHLADKVPKVQRAAIAEKARQAMLKELKALSRRQFWQETVRSTAKHRQNPQAPSRGFSRYELTGTGREPRITPVHLELRLNSAPSSLETPPTSPIASVEIRRSEVVPVPTRFTWLHLSDLHWSARMAYRWSRVWQNIAADLEQLSDLTDVPRSLDAVIISGDVVNAGLADEYRDVTDKALKPMWEFFNKRLGVTPRLIVVPGNHDLCQQDPSSAEVLRLVDGYLADDDFRQRFWEPAAGESLRAPIVRAFAAYVAWHEGVTLPRFDTERHGLLPGDTSCICEKSSVRFGVVGLNTAFLQLFDKKHVTNPQSAGEPFRGRLAVDIRQLHSVCGDGPAWLKEGVDVALLVTHHPPEWLSDTFQKDFRREIYAPGDFAVHLYGHMHEALQVQTDEGGDQRQFCQGVPLFAIESDRGGATSERRHGYTLGSLAVHDNDICLRFWPRKTMEKQAGQLELSADRTSILEADEGTRPRTLKRRMRNRAVG